MKSRDFCYWLQGFFEISNTKIEELNEEQLSMIKEHLKLVFKYDIDPSMGNQEEQQNLNHLHNFGIEDRC